MPVELGLEFVAVVGAHRVDAEGEALDDVIDEVDGAPAGVWLSETLRALIRVASSMAVYWNLFRRRPSLVKCRNF